VNDTDSQVILGDEQSQTMDRMFFVVRKENSDAVKPIAGAPKMGKLKLMPDDERVIMLDVSQYFDVTQMGNM